MALNISFSLTGNVFLIHKFVPSKDILDIVVHVKPIPKIVIINVPQAIKALNFSASNIVLISGTTKIDVINSLPLNNESTATPKTINIPTIVFIT